MAQWLRIYLPIQETGVQPLVWKDSTCCGATKARTPTTEPTRQNYGSPRALAATLCNKAATRARGLRTTTRQLPVLSTSRKKPGQQRRPRTANKNLIKVKKNPANIFLGSDRICLPGRRMFTRYKINGYSECIYFV